VNVDTGETLIQKKRLLLLTEAYPFGNGEPFLISEIPQLCKLFSVSIATSDTTSPLQKELPLGVPVYRLKNTLTILERIRYGLLFLGNKVCWHELFSIFRTKEKRLKRVLQSISMYSMGTMWFKLLEQLEDFGKQDILYSYWYNDKLIGAALALRKKQNRPIILSRLHGYDLYNERKTGTGRQPFKPLLDVYVDHFFFVSNAGYDYYQTTFGFITPDRFSISRLGSTNRFGMGSPHPGNELVLMSCSNVIPLKRVELIIKALALVDSIHVSWTHIGGGISLQEVQNLAKLTLEDKVNIEYAFTGIVQNSQIHEYYQTQPIDCFISVSQTEGGCPVSIQEAMSYGIPIIGTSVGGISEMIIGNGILLPANPTDLQVSEAIKSMYTAKETRTIEKLRKISREIWEKQFNADVNFLQFAQEVNLLHKV
jgi:glycosyltransferase involved in cell wall biosynthesis